MTFRAIDFETTGLPEDGPSGIMEVGWTDMRFDIIKPPQSFLVDCGIPVSVQARAIHHISDEMCAGELKPDHACMRLMEGMTKGEDYFVAHNVDHEKHYFGGGDIPFVCTHKTGLRIWPEAPGHKLNELRYFLDIDDHEDFDQALVLMPHRAAADSYICVHLLRRILKEITIEQAVKWSSGPALLWMCFMKKYKGTPWKDVPKDYLRWILEKSDITDRDIRATAKYYLNRPTTGTTTGA